MMNIIMSGKTDCNIVGCLSGVFICYLLSVWDTERFGFLVFLLRVNCH